MNSGLKVDFEYEPNTYQASIREAKWVWVGNMGITCNRFRLFITPQVVKGQFSKSCKSIRIEAKHFDTLTQATSKCYIGVPPKATITKFPPIDMNISENLWGIQVESVLPQGVTKL